MQILGIQIDKPFVRAALIDRHRDRVDILYLKSLLLEDPGDVKQLYTSSFKGKIVSGIETSELLLRPLEIQAGSQKHLAQVIAFQSDVAYHFPTSDVLSVPYLTKKSTQALLFTATREAIQEHLSTLKKLSLDPDLVSAEPLALMHYVQWKFPALADAFIIDLGSDQWSCIWMEKGSLQKFHAIPGGIEMLLADLWEDRKKMIFQKEIKGIAKQIDLLQIKTHLNPHLSSRVGEMRQELAKIIYSFHRLAGSRPILFTGRVDAFGHLREYLIGEKIKELICGEYSREIPLEEQKYAIPIGLALGSSAHSLQFRKEEFFPKKNWRKAGVYAVCLTFISLLFSFGLIATGQYAAHLRKQKMLDSLSVSLSAWDPLLKKTIFANNEEEAILSSWNQAVSSYSKEYPYLLQTPKVAEVLAYLHTHPLSSEISICSFRYRLLQFPKLEALREPYQAKVELEFQTKSALHARKFHEALLQDNALVDSAQEIGWDVSENKYRVSFFVKNRPSHVL